jgi:hypothetical protein
MSNQTNNGTSAASLLTIAFIVLKLTGVIAWSWWWVLSPLWISAGLVIVVFVVVVLSKIPEFLRDRKKTKEYHESLGVSNKRR